MVEMTAMRRVALVTGATSGIGTETAAAFVAAGFEVIGTGRSTAGLRAPAGVTYLDLDVASEESAESVVRTVIDRFGRLDVLVNNAGIGSAGAVEENSVERATRVLDINVVGVIRMTKAVLPHMRAQRGGRIINISSVLGIAPQPFMALYVASKHAIEGYSESAYTRTRFDTNALQPDTPLPLYAERRRIFDDVMEEAMTAGDDPAVVARVIVAAATDAQPKLRYTAGPLASRVTKARRLVPARVFDKQIRKNNRLPA
jgi:NAD(P)-dependent dehydrogenase (short-subunit alcohol dehydrogenase family)